MGGECCKVYCWDKSRVKTDGCKDKEDIGLFLCVPYCSSVDRLYIKRKNGGRGLISVVDGVRDEELA